MAPEWPQRHRQPWEYADSTTRIDASSGYNITENMKVSFEALNLTDTPFSTRVDIDARRRAIYNLTGRTFLLGARFSY